MEQRQQNESILLFKVHKIFSFLLVHHGILYRTIIPIFYYGPSSHLALIFLQQKFLVIFSHNLSSSPSLSILSVLSRDNTIRVSRCSRLSLLMAVAMNCFACVKYRPSTVFHPGFSVKTVKSANGRSRFDVRPVYHVSLFVCFTIVTH